MVKEIRADARMPSRLAGGYVRWLLTRPLSIVLSAIVAAALVLGLIAAALTREATALASVGFLIVIVALLPVIAFTQTRAAVRAAYPVGQSATLELLDDHLHTASRLGASDVRYDAIRRIDTTPTCLLLRLNGSRVVNVFPRELFSDADLATLRERVADATAHADR
ncbi:YcxB family protein [Microbacterium sp.]|uniref:YcxB family protein n=1 Tax=Microbacterium sp. TaxID=51671 RepID=UPI003A8BFE59